MNRRVLIVVADDDDDDQLLVKQAIAEILDCDVDSVYDGFELLEYLKRKGRFAGRDERLPDFVLLDLNMPKLDGFGVLSRIREMADINHIPIYILSTSSRDADKTRSLDLGARAFYTKPILYHQLKQIIGEISRREMS